VVRLSAKQVSLLRGASATAMLSRVPGMLPAAHSVQFVVNGIAAVRASPATSSVKSFNELILRCIS
jgi:multiple antibiotic resistance protein